MGFSEKLFELRKRADLSQKELAKKLGVAQASINYWEKGQRTPSIDMVSMIADFFEVSLDYLMGLEESGKIYGMTTFVDEIDYYLEDLGKFLYRNPDHKILFDASMEVKAEDINLAKELLDRINGKFIRYSQPADNNYVNAAHADNYAGAPEELKKQEEAIMDDDNF